MGAYHNTYFGVYIKIYNTEEKVEEEYYRNAGGYIQETKFNSETGEEHNLCINKINKINKFNHYNILKDFEDSFFSPAYVEGDEESKEGYVSLLSNTNHDLFSVTIDQCRTFDIPLDFSIKKAVEAFEEFYMAELKILRDNNVEFTFHCGIVNYAH